MNDASTQYEKIADYIPSNSALTKMADFFAVFSDITRIKIISALSLAELCVNELTELLGLNQSTVSHQLKLLRSCNIVKSQRSGKNILYSINNPKVFDIMLIGVESTKNPDKF